MQLLKVRRIKSGFFSSFFLNRFLSFFFNKEFSLDEDVETKVVVLGQIRRWK